MRIELGIEKYRDPVGMSDYLDRRAFIAPCMKVVRAQYRSQLGWRPELLNLVAFLGVDRSERGFVLGSRTLDQLGRIGRFFDARLRQQVGERLEAFAVQAIFVIVGIAGSRFGSAAIRARARLIAAR